MTTLDDRIAKFENMAVADPENDMAHFSLGNAYLQAGRTADAARSLQQCIELNPEMSKAYQLAGDALAQAGETDRAVEVLKKGYEVAAMKGDLMPRNAMGELLSQLGHEPELSEAAEAAAEKLRESGAFVCSRTGRPGTQLPEPPFRGPVGAWVRDHISAETWREWIGQGTKVINELHLDFSREEDQAMYDQYMYEYLGIDDAVLEELGAKV